MKRGPNCVAFVFGILAIKACIPVKAADGDGCKNQGRVEAIALDFVTTINLIGFEKTDIKYTQKDGTALLTYSATGVAPTKQVVPATATVPGSISVNARGPIEEAEAAEAESLCPARNVNGASGTSVWAAATFPAAVLLGSQCFEDVPQAAVVGLGLVAMSNVVSGRRELQDAVTCAGYTLFLPTEWEQKENAVYEYADPITKTVTIVLNYDLQEGLCGADLGKLDAFLDPPEDVQEILTMTIGFSIDIGVLTGKSTACEALSKQMGTADRFVIVDIDPDAVKESAAYRLLNGTAALEQKEKRRRARAKQQGKPVSKTKPTPATSLTAYAEESIFPIMPICMAIRPCGKNNKLGEEIMFGFYSDPGIPIIKPPPGGGLELKFFGLAFATDGSLIPPELELYDDHKPKGMHLWAKASIGFPITLAGKEVASIDIIGEIGAYGELNGRSGIGWYLGQLMDCGGSGANPGAFSNAIKKIFNKETTALFQIFARTEFVLTIDLKALCGIPINDFEISATQSSMLEVQFDASNKMNTHVGFYLTNKAGVDLAQLLGPIADMLGPFGEAIKDLVARIEVRLQLWLQLNLAGKVTFAFNFRLSASINCGPLNDIIAAFQEAFDSPIGRSILDKFPDIIDKTIGKALKLMAEICKPREAAFEVQLEFKNSQYNAQNTYIKLLLTGVGETKLSLDFLPTCPAPVPIGGKCSTNSDCEGPQYGDAGGYCKNHDTWKVSIGCLGTCIKRLPAGADCSKKTMNAFLFVKLNPFSAEHPACISNKCYCGVCTDIASEGLPGGAQCSENSDCASRDCDETNFLGITAGCKGRCSADTAGEMCRSDEKCKTCVRSGHKEAQCNGGAQFGDFGTVCRVTEIQASTGNANSVVAPDSIAGKFLSAASGKAYETVKRGTSHHLMNLPGMTSSYNYKCDGDKESFDIAKPFNRVYITYSSTCDLKFETYHCDNGFRGSLSYFCLLLLALTTILGRDI